MNKYEYTGDKTKNYFTAYLQKCIKWRRWNYLKQKAIVAEIYIDMLVLQKMSISIEEALEQKQKEELLLQEVRGEYPEWDELSDQQLVRSLLRLSEKEQKYIYQHIFEGRTFDEMSLINRVPVYKIKGNYFYAIRKIRKMMGER